MVIKVQMSKRNKLKKRVELLRILSCKLTNTILGKDITPS